MKKINETIKRIESHFVGDDCVQVDVPYKDSLTILNKDDILYHHVPGSPNHINKYLSDERREQFPYSNIPTYRAMHGLSIRNHTNQIFNFEEPYIEITGGNIMESYAVKDKKDALMITNVIPTFKSTKYVTRKELEELVREPNSGNEQFYIMDLDGSFYGDNTPLFLPTEQHIVEWTRNKFNEELEQCKTAQPHYFSPDTLQFFQHNINNMSIENVPSNIWLADNVCLIRTDKNNISIQIVSIKFIKQDYYKLDILNVPVTEYTLEQIKFLAPQIAKMKAPKVSPIINPGITKEDVQVAKKAVRVRKQNMIEIMRNS